MPASRSLVALVGAMTAVLLPSTPAPADTLVLDESFERSVAGWEGVGARTAVTRGGIDGEHAALVVSRRRGDGFSIRTARPFVTSPARGDTFRATASLRARRPGRLLCVRLQERGPRSVVAVGRRCVRATSRWRRVPLLTHRVRGPGHALVLLIGQVGGQRGDGFEVDGVSVRRSAARLAVGTRPPGASLPSEARCAAEVGRPSWELRPGNAPENHRRGRRLVLPADVWVGFTAWRARATRVTGNFTGTTDAILQWASCKWGFDADLTRAQAWVESRWDQGFAGDGGHSVGVLQVKSAVEGSAHRYTWPLSRTSTAFNVDYALAWRRACYEGHFAQGGWLPARSRGDLWGCVGLWFSGRWRQGDTDYVAAVRAALRAHRWMDGS